MKIARFQIQDGPVRLGVVRGDRMVDPASYWSTISSRVGLPAPASPDSLGSWIASGWLNPDNCSRMESVVSEILAGASCLSLSALRLLPPVDSDCQVYGVGRNFSAHAKERGAETPSEPVIFLKSATSLIGHQSTVIAPPDLGRVDHEAELAVVIGLGGSNIEAADAPSHIAGFTCFNDVTARDLQNSDSAKGLPWFRAKGRHTFGPIGPWLVTPDEIGFEPELDIICRVNGEVRQSGNTRDMTHSVSKIISYISSICPVRTGDVIALGTPAGIGPIAPGDVVEVEIERIGILSNPVSADADK